MFLPHRILAKFTVAHTQPRDLSFNHLR